MKAVAVFPHEQELSLVDEPEPSLVRPNDVLMRVHRVGVCGTDREICSFEYGVPPAGSSHLVLGHEAIAEVLDVGRAVTRFKRGDYVVPMVRRPCHVESCVPCQSGRADFCVTGEFTERGINGAHGFMTERIVEQQEYLQPVPAALADYAMLVEPLTIAEKALAQLHHLQQRLPWSCRVGEPGDRTCHTALVLGSGPVGMLGAMAFVKHEYKTIVYSREPEGGRKSELVESFGATYVSSSTTSVRDLATKVGPIDVVYEAVGASRFAFEAAHALGPNGVFIFTGVPGRKGPVEVDTDRLMRDLVLKNQVLLGTVNADRAAFADAAQDLLAFVERWPATVDQMVVPHAIDAYRTLLLEGGPGIKNVLTFAE